MADTPPDDTTTTTTTDQTGGVSQPDGMNPHIIPEATADEQPETEQPAAEEV